MNKNLNLNLNHTDCHMRDKCQKYDICPMVLVQDVLSGKRKILILWYLSYQKMRFGELKRRLPDVTQRMLTLQLRSLESDGLIIRKIFPEMPPRVEYSLSEKGRGIIPLLEMMHKFGAIWLTAENDK